MMKYLTLPGGPWNNKPRGGLRLNLAYTSPYINGNRTISFTILICFSSPPMQEKSFIVADIFLSFSRIRGKLNRSISTSVCYDTINIKISITQYNQCKNINYYHRCLSVEIYDLFIHPEVILQSILSLEFLRKCYSKL